VNIILSLFFDRDDVPLSYDKSSAERSTIATERLINSNRFLCVHSVLTIYFEVNLL